MNPEVRIPEPARELGIKLWDMDGRQFFEIRDDKGEIKLGSKMAFLYVRLPSNGYWKYGFEVSDLISREQAVRLACESFIFELEKEGLLSGLQRDRREITVETEQ